MLWQRFQALVRQMLFARGLLLLVAYTVILISSLVLAYALRFDFAIPPNFQVLLIENLFWIIPLELSLLFYFGQFGGLLSYFRLPDLYRVLLSLGIPALILVLFWYVFDPTDCPPRSVILGNFVFALLGIVAFRVGLRVIREQFFTGTNGNGARQRVAIVGAGDVGAQVAGDLLGRRGTGMRPVVFIDDDQRKLRRHVHGVPVVDSPENLPFVKEKYGIDAIIIAMPSAPVKRVGQIVAQARRLGLRTEIVPSLAELTSGRVRASRIRPVEIEDLLGREPVTLDSQGIREMIAGRTVMVTGAGGSIGSELCRQIAEQNPKRLLMVEQAEFGLFESESRLTEEGYGGIILPLIGDILDEARMRGILASHRPEIVFHAAAHKHVFLMERHPGEAVKNNVFGTRLMADLAGEFGVKRFVLISTDKAINPTSVMGATKRLAELYLQARQAQPGNQTIYCAVRFGNVLGSSGSVVPIFRRQIALGGPVKVTHPDVTRYFMTIPEAVGLVLQSATQGSGGEIFVLDMGTPVKIIDLARQMIELSGLRPEIDIDIEFIGLRPGEKLFEELQHVREKLDETSHERIFRFVSEAPRWEELEVWLTKLRECADQAERNPLKQLLKERIPEYSPFMD